MLWGLLTSAAHAKTGKIELKFWSFSALLVSPPPPQSNLQNSLNRILLAKQFYVYILRRISSGK